VVCSNFGLFRHPGSNSSSAASINSPSTARSEESSASTVRDKRSSRAGNDQSHAIDKIHAAGLLDVYWHGKCEAEKVTTGTYQVKGLGGMFALVYT